MKSEDIKNAFESREIHLGPIVSEESLLYVNILLFSQILITTTFRCLGNGHPDTVKQYTLAITSAYSIAKVKADLSEMFTSPVEYIYTLSGKKIHSVEDMFDSGDLAFVASFGESFREHPGYAKVQNGSLPHKLPPITRHHLSSPTEASIHRSRTKVITPTSLNHRDDRPVIYPESGRSKSRDRSRSVGSQDQFSISDDNILGPVKLFKPLHTELRPQKRRVAFDIIDSDRGRNSRSRNSRDLVDVPDESSFSVIHSWPDMGRGDDYLFPQSLRKNKGRGRGMIKSDYEETDQTESDDQMRNISKPKRSTPIPPAERLTRIRREKQHSGNQTWAIRLLTGQMPKGVSTSQVIITAYGHRGASEPIHLIARKKKFFSGSSETFKAKIENIGDIYKLRLEITNSGSHPDLFCNEVFMENPKTGEQLHFPCRKWFSDRLADRQTVREIASLSDTRPPVSSKLFFGKQTHLSSILR